jgi:hypothetical protein
VFVVNLVQNDRTLVGTGAPCCLTVPLSAGLFVGYVLLATASATRVI